MKMQPAEAAFFGQFDRAGRVARIDAQSTLLNAAIDAIKRDGHTILTATIGLIKPVIQLMPSARLEALEQTDKAACWMRGVDDFGQHYRKWQLLDYRNVLVIWTERGH